MKLRILLPILIGVIGIVLAAIEFMPVTNGGRAVVRDSKGPIYAFQYEINYPNGTVDIMSGTLLLASQPGYHPIFSPNGRYVLSSEPTALYIYDLHAARKYSRPLVYQPPEACLPQAIGNKYVYVADPQLIRYSLPGFSDPVHLTVRLPSGAICPMGSIGNNALIVIDSQKGWELYEVDPDGASRHIGPHPLWPTYQWAALSTGQIAATIRAANGDPEIAYETFNNNSGYGLNVLDVRTNSVFVTNTAELDLPINGAGKANNLYIGSIWWANDGYLYAVMSSYNDNDLVTPQQVWRLDGRSWVPWNSVPLVDVRFVTAGDSVALMPESGYLDRPWGDLYLRTRSSTILIRKAVDEISVPADESIPPPSTTPRRRSG